nr:putative fam50a [Toxoplasma gondii COUG]
MSNLGESGNAVLQTIQASEGGRALRLLRQRQEMRERMRAAKEKIESKGLKRNLTFGGSAADRLEEQFKKETVGLITAKDFRDKRAKLEEQIRVEQRSLFPQ